jgi:hypothetical protein
MRMRTMKASWVRGTLVILSAFLKWT